ncbi:uncharacterized protein LOC114862077 [Betta splendens]|uniref:Uncharacterized protein LOC114862077 n=1 Tax=Betta splendens TaxID=158456 RepID=A0A9W2Y0Z1_BETSP|nr:uncharacterized protein LOC114862077 [Betta splendens]XP_055367521.1 uncharacterized protein LOC114862077 [Betta splendens]XP_055367525.1 uncharacterized protein LOC114862077 [Betta splendens]XP_055367528.1 uncharacterized protein LOC114862077 [Betta splendens]XP_055367532.1 uncharacterized protein LOC114862077 [Betta splendens]XP_055367535.1 uncharacterized protein LOC114862077 [Betta splendens]
MPLKILIALAMVNKSPVATCRGCLKGAGIHVCCSAGPEHKPLFMYGLHRLRGEFQPLFDTDTLQSRAAGVERRPPIKKFHNVCRCRLAAGWKRERLYLGIREMLFTLTAPACSPASHAVISFLVGSACRRRRTCRVLRCFDFASGCKGTDGETGWLVAVQVQKKSWEQCIECIEWWGKGRLKGRLTKTTRGKRRRWRARGEEGNSRPRRTGSQAWVWRRGPSRRCGVERSVSAHESPEGGFSAEDPRGMEKGRKRRREGRTKGSEEGKIPLAPERRSKRMKRARGERGKVWTMTQGHEPHGDGGGREELLIRACGVSYGYHRTGSVLPSWLRLSRHATAAAPSGRKTAAMLYRRAENGARGGGGCQGELGVKFTPKGSFLNAFIKQRCLRTSIRVRVRFSPFSLCATDSVILGLRDQSRSRARPSAGPESAPGCVRPDGLSFRP